MTGYKKREMVIEGLNAIHAVACGTGGDECYLNNIGIKQLQTMIDDATELLKAQEPKTIEERITLNKLHNIRIYAQVAKIGWIDEAAAYAETVMGLLREEIHRMQKAQEPHIVTIADYKDNPNVDKGGNLAVWRESRRFNGIAYYEDGWIVLNRDWAEWFNSEVIRFWTSRPTDKQREATPWEAEP